MIRNTTVDARRARSAMLAGLFGALILWGCSPQVDKGQTTGEAKGPDPSRFLELLQAGLSDRTDLSPVVSEIVGSSNPKIEALTEASDPYRLKFWKEFLEGDEFVEPSNLRALKLLDVSAEFPAGEETSTVLFLQRNSKPDWICWVRQRHEGASVRFDLTVPPSTLTDLIHRGLSDRTDLSGTISGLFSLDAQRKSDPELTRFTLVSSTEVTDEVRLNAMKGLLEGDSLLIPSRIAAIKAFDLEFEQAFHPARPADGHGDVPHDGRNSLMVLFVLSKAKDGWIYWGSYI